MNPLVSIIVPVYNAEQHLERCITSLLLQDYSHYEILLINDGSTDRSGTICEEFHHSNPIIKVFHTENKGVSAARNYGIECAKGEFIQFVDSDDDVERDYISGMIKDSRSVDLVISGLRQVRYHDGSMTLLQELVCKKEGNFAQTELSLFFNDMIQSSYVNYCYGKLIRRQLLIEHNIRFREDISLGEDTLFVIDLLRRCKYICLSTNISYNYVIHSDQTLTYKYRSDKFLILSRLHKEIVAFCLEQNCYDSVSETLQKRYMETIRFCLDENFKSGLSRIRSQLKQLNSLLENEDIQAFVTQDNIVLRQYPRMLVQAIASQRGFQYYCVYYMLIIRRKFGGGR
ncbi:glycosyltransferase family 2 protein [Paenibacillus sp. L3-i20]|uniref:glycosyltransferase family 2 protein n=1 Tax=Paenibacillus sp. L3-i20 TaxID=2905833 RepID=UPI001EDCFCE4|nr:glycosyltransferase family 2 protein [Paenibacillus sp. L3-i20]GKU75833.1 hypothetical protein L3i20_v202300 [Paenibacillus sp. L3-i20]